MIFDRCAALMAHRALSPARRLPLAWRFEVRTSPLTTGSVAGGCRQASTAQDGPVEELDALIVGGGVMGCSVGMMMKILHPTWKIRIVEQLDRVGAECSNEWRNAGTGHAALCEPNYTPMDPITKEVDISKAVAINNKFLVGMQWWAWLVEKGVMPDASFIQPAPHISFVHGEKNVEWLRKRFEKLKPLPSFAAMEYTEDFDQIKEWVPLLCSGRSRSDVIACTRHPGGTECNFGLLTRYLAQSFSELGGEVQLLSTVASLVQQPDKSWLVGIKKNHLASKNSMVRTKIVFAGAGGGTLRVLQMAGLPEVRGYAGMPVSGKFLVCQSPEVIAQNKNKVYSPAAVGAPPMSVPHLDWRTIYGRDCIFFGPFAGFKPTVFNNTGSPLDWLCMLNLGNLWPLVKTGLKNMDLMKYLIKELFASKQRQLGTLREFVPDARAEDWTMIWAGQRITTVHPDGKLMFGTEVMASADKTIVGLLGASPGASVSPHIALEVLDHFEAATMHQQQWHAALAQMIPSYGRDINSVPGLYDQVFAKVEDVLLTGELSGHWAANQHIERTFKRLDVHKSGTMSVEELRQHLEAQGVEAEAITAIVDRLDADKSGEITQSEFTAGFSDFVTGQLKTNRQEL